MTGLLALALGTRALAAESPNAPQPSPGVAPPEAKSSQAKSDEGKSAANCMDMNSAHSGRKNMNGCENMSGHGGHAHAGHHHGRSNGMHHETP